jgi:hypothetical protein
MNSTNTMHPNRITVWGSYQWGNFGDDLMAVMIALFLKSQGFSPIVYRLHPSIASIYNIDTSQDLEEALAGSSALIVGGGNFLGSVSLIDNDWVELEECISVHNIPIHFTSIGGDGSESPRLCPSAYRVLASNRVLSGTVRLKTDLPAFKLINPSINKLNYYHDIVLGASSFFPATKPASKPQYCIYNISYSRGAKVVDLLSSSLQAIGKPAVKFALTHLECLTSDSSYTNLRYEYNSPDSSNNIRYNDIQSYVDLISSACFLASSKLHLGVAAMSYGVPFISINGAGKTLACMGQVGFHDATLSCNLSNPAKLPKLLLDGTMNAKAAKQRKGLSAISNAKDDSNGHWEMLLEFLGRI